MGNTNSRNFPITCSSKNQRRVYARRYSAKKKWNRSKHGHKKTAKIGCFAFIAFLAKRIEGFGLKGRFWPERTRRRGRRRRARRFAADFDWIIYVSLRGEGRSELIGASQTALVCFGEKASTNIEPVESDVEPFIYFLYLTIESNVKRILYRGYWGALDQYSRHNDGRHRCTLVTKMVQKNPLIIYDLNKTFLYFISFNII